MCSFLYSALLDSELDPRWECVSGSSGNEMDKNEQPWSQLFKIAFFYRVHAYELLITCT
jgi:hypothetical protein